MTLEELKAKGLTEEQAKEILALHKTAIDGNYIPKSTFEVEREAVKTLKTQVEERDTQISTLGTFKGTAEGLVQEVDKLKKANEEAAIAHDLKVKEITQLAALRSEIAAFAHDADDVISKLDQTKITFKDGKVTAGLKEQLETLKKDKPHYFKEVDTGKQGLPEGWAMFGKPPADSGESGASKGEEAAKFGSELAKLKATSTANANKAADLYFK